jgi:hypothetical protein
MTEGTPVKDPYLEEIVKEIRKECSFFEEIEFHHVSRKHNKRADQLATAASISSKAGNMALRDRDWDPRVYRERSIDTMDLVHRAARYQAFSKKEEGEDWFPSRNADRPENSSKKSIQEAWRVFPKLSCPVGTKMGKVRLSTNMTSFTESNLERSVILQHEWDIHTGFKSLALKLGVTDHFISYKGDAQVNRSKNRRLPSWTSNEGSANAKGRRKTDTVRVEAAKSQEGTFDSAMQMSWNMNPGSSRNMSRRRPTITIMKGSTPPFREDPPIPNPQAPEVQDQGGSPLIERGCLPEPAAPDAAPAPGATSEADSEVESGSSPNVPPKSEAPEGMASSSEEPPIEEVTLTDASPAPETPLFPPSVWDELKRKTQGRIDQMFGDKISALGTAKKRRRNKKQMAEAKEKERKELTRKKEAMKRWRERDPVEEAEEEVEAEAEAEAEAEVGSRRD